MIGFLLMAATLAVAPGPCSLQTPRTADGALAAERYWVSAIERRDAPALACLLEPGFTDINWRGMLVTRGQMLDVFFPMKSPRLTLDQLTTDVLGDVAIVRGRNAQTGPDGKPAGAVRFTDGFVYRGGAWRAFRAQETLIRN